MDELSDSAPAEQGSLLARVDRLADVIRAGGDEAQELRRCPTSVIDALIDAGLFRFTIPCELGGENASIGQTIEVIEAISAIDASVGWNVMLGSEINAMAAGGMPRDLAEEVYVDDPRVVMCGGGGPGTRPSKAVAQPDGSYRVWAHATFISGCHNATWCFMIAPIVEDDSVKLVDGAPVVKLWMLHRSEWEIIDTWDVAGLRGSGSHDVVTDGGLVPARFAAVDLVALPALYDNPVFRVPVPLRLAYNKAAVAIGVARGALDAFVDLANTKTPLLSSTLLRDRPVAQLRMGEGEANLRAARAFLFEAMGRVDEELSAGRDAPSATATQVARLACTHAVNVSMHVVDAVHNAAGTTAMRMDSPLERRLRDAHGCATHRWVAQPLYAELGRIFLGHEPPPEFAGAGGPLPAAGR
ncbi:MAG: acyl-CoA dehydrogenase family protein [Ilumatobacteraceae bacterium]